MPGLPDLRALRPSANASLRAWNGREPDGRIDELLEDPLGRFGGDLLDLHAAVRARHHTGCSLDAIDDEAEVQLALDLQPLLDEHAPDYLPFGPGLVGHERHAEHSLGGRSRLLRTLGDLDAAAFAAAAGMNLRLDDRHAAAEAVGDSLRVSRVEHDFARGTGTPYFARSAFA